MYITSLLTVGIFAGLSAAAPATQQVIGLEDVNSAACTINLPKFYQLISRATPTTSFQQSRLFQVNQAAGSTNNVDTLVSFTNIPKGSFGCQLAMSFTFEFPINSTGSTQLNVYALPNPIKSTDTYETYFPQGGRGTPKGSYLFATTTITGQKAVLNSQTCAPTLGYLFEIASPTDAGTVTFVDAGNNLSGIGGFYLSYNC